MLLGWAGSLRQACIKTLTSTELYQRKGFNGVRELQALFGQQACQKPVLFSLSDVNEAVSSVVNWQVAEAAPSGRSRYRLQLPINAVLAQAIPGDNIVIGRDLSGEMRCVIFKPGHDGYQGRMTNWTRYC